MGVSKPLSAALCLVAGLVAAPPSAQAHSDDPAVVTHWGASVGLLGVLPVGGDTSQTGAPEDEFQVAMAMQIEIPTLEFYDLVELVPFARFNVLGGVNETAYEAAFDTAQLDGGTEGQQLLFGAGLRFAPFHLPHDLRPYLGIYGAYSQARLRYRTQQPPGAPTGGFGGDSAAGVRKHDGAALSLGLGVRWDLALGEKGFWGWMPLRLELQYTGHFYRSLQNDPSIEANPAFLADEGMRLHQLSLMFSVGYGV